MGAEAYVQAWKKLKKHLEKKAEQLGDGTAAKTAVLQVLFQMDIMEPQEDE